MTILGILVSMITYTAQQARQRFGEILDLVKYKGETIQVTRAGTTIAFINAHASGSPTKTDSVEHASISDEDAKLLRTLHKSFRRSFRLTR